MAMVRPAPDGATLELVLPQRPAQRIHPLWLRERCSDPRSLDASTGQRLYNPSELDAPPGIVTIEPAPDGTFRIEFSDGHQGVFSGQSILAELPGEDSDLPAPAAWSSASQLPPNLNWADCQTETGCLAALESYLLHGYAILDGVPARPGAVLEVARRFGFPRETNFGTLFDVRSVPDANDLAYTSLPLDPHTDNPYRTPVPGIQLLHCLANQTPGGLSTLVDGLAVAQALREEAPDAFDILTRIEVRFRYEDARAALHATAKLIDLGPDGNFVAIHYSPRLDFVPLLPPDILEQFYQARRQLDFMLKSDRFERRFKLCDGQLMMFDNRRLLHGRTGFDPRLGLRHLQGCYIDADGPASLYRVLRRACA